MSVQKIKGLIHPTVAECTPENLKETDLPFVQFVKKGKKKRLSFWHTKKTGDHRLDKMIGRSHAVELVQFMMMKPELSTYIFQKVMEDLKDKEVEDYPLASGFVSTIAELVIVGANARAKVIQVDTTVEVKS